MKDYSPEVGITKDSDEITMRDLVTKLRAYGHEIRRSWLTLLLICLPFLVWQGYLAFTKPVMYESKLTFMVDDDAGGGAGLLNSILGDFGLGGAQKNNNDKIIELAKSMYIMRKALFEKVSIDGQNDYLANHFIRIQKLQEEEWNKKSKKPDQPSLEGFMFSRDSFDQFNRTEYAALKSIYGWLNGDEKHTALFGTDNDPDSDIMTFNLNTRSETLTIMLLRAIFEQLSEFYILSSTEKQQTTLNIVRAKSDSLRRLLTGTEYSAARFREQNNLLLRPTDQLPSERLSREKGMYGIMYGEALKNMEIADFSLRNKIPYIQAIDFPIPPITGIGYSKKKALALGLALGLFIGITFVVVRKIIRDNILQISRSEIN